MVALVSVTTSRINGIRKCLIIKLCKNCFSKEGMVFSFGILAVCMNDPVDFEESCVHEESW